MAQSRARARSPGSPAPSRSNPLQAPLCSKQPAEVLGFRAVFFILGSLPGLALVTIVPVIALRFGYINVPNIMISDLMVASPNFESMYNWGFNQAAATNILTFLEVGRYFKTHPLASDQLQEFSGRLVWWYCVAACPGLVLLTAFNFDGYGYLIHAAATVLYFIGAIMCVQAFYRACLEARRLGMPYPSNTDLNALKTFATGIILCTVISIVVRWFHVQDKETWCYPMVIMECLTITCAVVATVVSSLRLLMHLDATDPLGGHPFAVRAKKIS
jgi:hypothetical protein